MERESFVFYKSFYVAISTLPEDEQLSMYKAVVEQGLFGAKPNLQGYAKGMYELITPQIKANNKRFINGCKGAKYGKLGGRPKTPKKPQENPKETPNDNVNVNDNDNVNVNDNDNVNVNDIITTPTATKPIKHKYGEHKNVLLTDEEYLKLKERYPNDYKEKIDNLSVGIALKGYKYKSHYLAVIKWANNEKQRAKTTVNNKPDYSNVERYNNRKGW